MRVVIVLGVVGLLWSGVSRADCPTSGCVAGGGPAATDCFVQWGGITDAKQVCTDGDPSCDTDGVADGVCTLGLTACVNVTSAGCTPAALTAAAVAPTTLPAESALQSTLTSLVGNASQICAAPAAGFAIPLNGSGTKLGPVKNGVAKFKVTATAGKKDVDKLKLQCAPGAQLARDVQPIFTAKCAIPSCHSGPTPSGGHTLEDGQTYADNVNVKALIPSNGLRIKPGNVKASFLVKKIIAGVHLNPVNGGAFMPQGCPGLPPAGGCLTDQEILTIMSWIQRGAPND